MKNDLHIKLANKISDELISLWKNNKTKNKSIINLFNELLDDKYEDIKYSILSYIPEVLSVRGYEIVDSENFELKKY
jgi:hypothetical protein